MKKLFIVANWKSHKTIKETEQWLHDFHKGLNSKQVSLRSKEIIIAPSFNLLEHAHYSSNNLKFILSFAAQNVSCFDEGPYTGEVSARQIRELVSYVIIGHSERREHFAEDQSMIDQKIQQALKYELVPILCISNLGQIKNEKLKMIVAYEPLFAIGSGKPDTPENASEVSGKIKEVLGKIPVLYGGSVSSENVSSFTKMPNIDGVLVGGASLDPRGFLEIINNA